MNSQNKKLQPGEGSDDNVLQKLEEMWDRKIMKGDGEFLESRISSHHQKPERAGSDVPAKKRKRRGRKM